MSKKAHFAHIQQVPLPLPSLRGLGKELHRIGQGPKCGFEKKQLVSKRARSRVAALREACRKADLADFKQVPLSDLVPSAAGKGRDPGRQCGQGNSEDFLPNGTVQTASR